MTCSRRQPRSRSVQVSARAPKPERPLNRNALLKSPPVVVEVRARIVEPRLSQRRTRNRERVDRIGLASHTAAAPCGAVSFGG